MKDYYYILGLSADASDQDIRVAYKKLSIKFHPDKNAGDTFFEEHFKEIQEAYAVLGKPEKRAQYDRSRMPVEQRRSMDMNRPIIQNFSISKNQIYTGDLVTLTWKVIHADKVHISVLGDVLTQGTKTIRLKQLGDAPALVIKLQAANSNTQQTVEKQLIVKNKEAKKNLQLLLQQDKTIQEVDDSIPITPQPNISTPTTLPTTINNAVSDDDDEEITKQANSKNDIVVYIVVLVIMVFITILAFLVYRLNGLS